MRTGQSIECEDVIKKEARGTNDDDLGEVQDIGDICCNPKRHYKEKNSFCQNI
jgi:hypothetical protein